MLSNRIGKEKVIRFESAGNEAAVYGFLKLGSDRGRPARPSPVLG